MRGRGQVFKGDWMDDARDMYAYRLAEDAYHAARKVIRDSGCDAGIGLAACELVGHWMQGSARAQLMTFNGQLARIKMDGERATGARQMRIGE